MADSTSLPPPPPASGEEPACPVCSMACHADFPHAAHNLRPHRCLDRYQHGDLVPWTCPTCGKQWAVRDSQFVPAALSIETRRILSDPNHA